MAYNSQSLINEIIDLAKDPTFPRSRVLAYIQRTSDAVLGRHRFKFNEQRTTDDLTISAVTHAYDADHQQIIQVVLSHLTLSTPQLPEYVPSNEFFERWPVPDTNTPGLPSYYTDYGHELYFDRPVDLAYTLAMRYLAAPARLTDTDTSVPQIPEEFKSILIKGGLSGIEKYRENDDIAALYDRDIEDLSSDMLGRYGLRKMQPGKARPIRRRSREW